MPSQSDLRYSFQPLVGKAEFEVGSFELREGISTPFELELKLISFENDIDFGHLLDKPVLFTIWKGGRPVRYVHGLVSRFSQAESGFYRTYYDAAVVETADHVAPFPCEITPSVLNRLGWFEPWRPMT